MDDAIQQTLADVVDILARAHMRFALIGGLAVTVRGEPRVTADVDLVLGIDVERALELVKHLSGTPLRPLFAGVDELVQTALLLPLRHERTRIKVDLAIGLSGFEHQVIARATCVPLAGREVPVATAEDLILMKLLASRPRDTSDIDGIVARQREALDWGYLFQTGASLQESLEIDILPHLERLR